MPRTPEGPASLTAAWFEAWRDKDANFVARRMAANYVYVAPNGMVMDRAAILAIARDPTYGITEGTHSEVVTTPLGADVALVRHRWRGRGTFRGQEFVDDHQCVMIWHREEDGWRVRYEQASPVSV
jgi:ketosteroid isomerase-like protein